jgi:hypothetical protein
MDGLARKIPYGSYSNIMDELQQADRFFSDMTYIHVSIESYPSAD